jgi:hypothetical protein
MPVDERTKQPYGDCMAAHRWSWPKRWAPRPPQ